MKRFLLVLPYLLPLGVVGTVICLGLTFSQVDASSRLERQKIMNGFLKGILYLIFLVALFFLGRWVTTLVFT